MEEGTGDISKHVFENKSFHHPYVGLYDFETMFVKVEDQPKLE